MGSQGSVPAPWFSTSPFWTNDHKTQLLHTRNETEPPPKVSLTDLIEKSAQFPRKFPIDQVKCEQLKAKVSEETLERNINSTYPVIHEHALYLCSIFLIHQKRFGNRDFYENMSLLDLIDRFLSKRAIAFLNVEDEYMLLDGTRGRGGWEAVGTPNEKPRLVLDSCLSYDEMKLSAFLSLSSHTVFINDGNRKNRGVFEDDRLKLEDDGIIMGLIGPRLPKPYVMEFREVVKMEAQNNQRYGYGQSLVPTLQGQILNFYGDVSTTYEEMLREMQENQRRFVRIEEGFFDTLVYSRRVALSIDTLLIEANERAKSLGKMAYVHVVGLGLGVWKIYLGQDKLFMDTFIQRMELLSPTLTNISDICFAYIDHKMAGKYKHGDRFNNIKLHMVDKQGPHVKLCGEDEGKLLVVSFAWDSNSLPGNEFWFGYLESSSDPAAACSTQVAELHNWHINSNASAKNLRVATLKGLVTFREYQQMHSGD